MTHGSYLGLGFISTGLLVYLIYPKIQNRIIACSQRPSPGMRTDQYVNSSTGSTTGKQQAGAVTTKDNRTTSSILVSANDKPQETESRDTPTQASMSVIDLTRVNTPPVTPKEKPSATGVVQLPLQRIQPAYLVLIHE